MQHFVNNDFFGTKFPHANVQCAYNVLAKYQIVSSYNVVRVDWHAYALSMHKQNPFRITKDVYLEAINVFARFDETPLAWPTVVQLVGSFNSGLQWGISQEYSFFVSSQWSIWFCVLNEMHWLS